MECGEGIYEGTSMTKRFAFLLFACSLMAMQPEAFAQSGQSREIAPAKVVSRTIKAVNYRRGGSTKIGFSGTSLMGGAYGEAKVESKKGRVDLQAQFFGLEEATKFGLEYLTYVMWAMSPQGRAVNLGEVQIKNGQGQVRATTELQTFAMIVTAEPYFAVTQPSELVVMENRILKETAGRVDEVNAKFELLQKGVYSSTNAPIREAIFGIDRKTPLDLFQARNALRIARLAGTEKYAPSVLQKADQQLKQAEEYQRRKQNKGVVSAAAREAAQTAEDARVMALKAQEEERQSAERRAAEEREARARALAELEVRQRQEADARRQQAEADRAQAELAKQGAERMKQEALAAAQEAARQREEADAARAAALAQQHALQAEAEKARSAAQDAHAARQEAERLRQQAEQEKAELRARLLQQLNSILETRDSARGLIASMSDVLFETGSYTLRPLARERLAKVSGILLAYRELRVDIEGHTDSVGSDAYNQRLSEQRANSVREYFVQQGIPEASIAARGFGKSQPIADNMTSQGRQQNRRVELVLSGDAIGTKVSANDRFTGYSASR
jgi:outer membrane protein OmpA-like peptidoglycan-associated protein